MSIKCGYCGQRWEIYQRDNWNSPQARQCPHCFSKIDAQTWSNQVVPAFGAVCDANMELAKDHSGYHLPMFTVDVIADHYFTAEQDQPGQEEIEEAEEDLDVPKYIIFHHNIKKYTKGVRK